MGIISWLHNFSPDPVLLQLGPITVYWYGALMVVAIIVAIIVAIKLAPKYDVSKEAVIDLAFWLIIFGIAGARIYHVFLELPYYLGHPLDVFKLWNGGLAIHGAVLAGVAVLYVYTRRHNYSFWVLAGMLAPALALAQAVGRWGNYFNQELFGYPTDLAWGIPIAAQFRPVQYLHQTHFHPAFLYESAGNLAIFAVLLVLHMRTWRKKEPARSFSAAYIVLAYIILYSILRFTTEFIRVDRTPEILGMRFPQLISLGLVIGATGLGIWLYYRQKTQSQPRA